jgi:zinc protease
VIRDNLGTESVQYVFVTRDADDLRQRLVSDQASPIRYEADKPQELLDEDMIISTIPLGFSEDKVSIVGADTVFN